MDYKRINIRFPMEFYSLIKKESEKLGIPVSSFINVAVNEYIKQNSLKDMSDLMKKLETPEGRYEFKL